MMDFTKRMTIEDLDRLAAQMSGTPGWLVEPRYREMPNWIGCAIAMTFDFIGDEDWREKAHAAIHRLTIAGCLYSVDEVLQNLPHLGRVKVARLRFM